MKHFLIQTILLFALNVCAQSPINIDKNGLATLNGKAWLQTKDTASQNIHITELKKLSGEIIAVLTFIDYEDKVFFKGTFASKGLEYEYEVNYPFGTNLQIILESYYKNKVIENEAVNLSGLEKYCKDRNIELVEMMVVDVVDPPSNYNNSTYSYSSQNQTTNTSPTKQNNTPVNQNVSFKLKNNSSKTVRYFIGTKAKYGSGSTKNIGGNNLTNEYATVGQQFCIVDTNNNPISCLEITSSTQKIEINVLGTGFGK